MENNDSLAHSKSNDLITTLSEVIRASRKKAFQAINSVQVQTCWLIGRHIIEFVQDGLDRAEYGKGIINHVAESLTMEYGKGFDDVTSAICARFTWHFQNGTHCVPN